jgi:hypothetical protein
MQDAQHLVEIGEHMGLGAAKRGHADPGEPLPTLIAVAAPGLAVPGAVLRFLVIMSRPDPSSFHQGQRVGRFPGRFARVDVDVTPLA